jgi:hypothetical protein
MGAVIATAVALPAFVAIGVISWDAVAGLQGVCICGALGTAAGAALGSLGLRAPRIIGGGISASYFALASGERCSSLYLGASRIICGDNSLRRSISRLNERETQRCGWTSKQLGRR